MSDKTKTTFVEFIKNHDIQIPLIQRDYVQGLAINDKMKEKRDDFVRKLLNALLPLGQSCTLDFIYGAREDYGSSCVSSDLSSLPFLPLDGQQRLTTLFLLHWLLLEKVQPTEVFQIDLKILSKFSYKTRISSGRFCHKLIESDFTKESSLISQIQKKYWYDSDMKSDPTIMAMMQMLKLMEDYLKDEPYCLHLNEMTTKLFEENSLCITFDLLDMDKYHLSDGLYVKMNARGKELTPFENWKADFIDLLSNDEKMKSRFTDSIEHGWNDVFWVDVYRKYINDKESKEAKESKSEEFHTSYPRIDEHFMNFFNNMSRLLFFIDPSSSDVKAEDYKSGLGTTFCRIYKGHTNVQQQLFDFLDTLHSIYSNGNGGIDKFFDDLFYTERSSGWENQTIKVKLFDDLNINLFTEIKQSDKFDWTQILLYAILTYCTKYKVYSVSENLCNYVRICRNYLYEHKQLVKGEVHILSNVRVTEMCKYAAVFSYLCSDANPLVSLSADNNNEFIRTEHNKLKYEKDLEVYALVRKLEDMSLTHGCIKAFSTLLDKCLSDHSLCQKVWNAILAFHDAPSFQKVRAFVAFDYRGIDMGRCSYGHRILLGSSYKGEHWMVHFRVNDNSKAMNHWSDNYVTSFIEHGDIAAAINSQKPESPTSLKDYMLIYDDVLAAQVWWLKDKNNAPFYYAMPDPWKDFDMIVIHSFSSRPLGNSYQVCPMTNAVVRQIQFNDQLNGRIGYLGQGVRKGDIIINKDKNWDNRLFSLHFGHKNWHTNSDCFNNLNNELQNRFIKNVDDNNDYILSISVSKDLISEAVDLMDCVVKYFSTKGML